MRASLRPPSRSRSLLLVDDEANGAEAKSRCYQAQIYATKPYANQQPGIGSARILQNGRDYFC